MARPGTSASGPLRFPLSLERHRGHQRIFEQGPGTRAWTWVWNTDLVPYAKPVLPERPSPRIPRARSGRTATAPARLPGLTGGRELGEGSAREEGRAGLRGGRDAGWADSQRLRAAACVRVTGPRNDCVHLMLCVW